MKLRWALSQVGLAEAHTYLLTPAELSAGQQWRLRLALALSHRRRPLCLICDEFAALLDRVSAAIIAHTLRKAVYLRNELSAILATSHDNLQTALNPDLIITCDFGAYTIRTPNPEI